MEYTFLAPQNSQAALIGGHTIHRYGNIAINHGKRRRDTAPDARDIKLALGGDTRNQPLSQLHLHLTAASRSHDSWASSPNREPRIFAGVNLLMAGDFWQFGAVKATRFTQNPFHSTGNGAVQRVQSMFWTKGFDAITHFRELTQEQRCQDAWLSHFRLGARRGTQSEEDRSYAHGFATAHRGSWQPWAKTSCGKATCAQLELRWAEEVKGQAPRDWQRRQQDECGACQLERRRRCAVAGTSALSPILGAGKFAGAPFIHALNAAKYAAIHTRARNFARQHQRLLLRVVAQDMLLNVDAGMEDSSSQPEQWLRYHDQRTSGIMGLLLLVANLPIRFTETTAQLKEMRIFKHTRGVLRGWSLHPGDEARVNATHEHKLVLQHMPLALHVGVMSTSGDLPSMTAVRPTTTTWTLGSHADCPRVKRRRYT